MPMLLLQLDMPSCSREQQEKVIEALTSTLCMHSLQTPDFCPDSLIALGSDDDQTSWVTKARALSLWLRANPAMAQHVRATGLCLHDRLSTKCIVAIESTLMGHEIQFFWPQLNHPPLEWDELPADFIRDFGNKDRWPLALQPVHDFESHRALYEEVLARSAFADQNQAWFVQGLESQGKILELDTQIIHRAISALFQNPALRLGINASRRSFGHPDWLAALCSYKDKALLSRLYIEITETQDHVDADQTLLQACLTAQETGVNLILDDLGSGATTIDEMFDLPLKFVKLDKALVAWLYEGNCSYDLIGDLLATGAQVGWGLIAEGASDAAMLDFVRGSGVTLIQGFAIRRPRLSSF